MMVKGDSAIEVGERSIEALRNRPQSVFGKIAITIVKRMKEGQQGSGLAFPTVNQLFIGSNCHQE
jgi:hypothetical protein